MPVLDRRPVPATAGDQGPRVNPPRSSRAGRVEPASPRDPARESRSAGPIASPVTQRPEYVLIVGVGRSGTNWLAGLLDLSAETHVRNEPNALQGSPLGRLPVGLLPTPDPEAFGPGWEAAIAWTSRRQGERDSVIRVPKAHLYRPVWWLGGAWLLSKTKVRRALSAAAPELAGSEWRVPRWLGRRSRLEDALPVIKVIGVPGWVGWVLTHRARVRVVHIARHPGGFLNSWRNRVLRGSDPERVRRDNADRLRSIAAAVPSWSPRFGDIESMSVEESELWFWCYVNETIAGAGAGSPGYERVIYEDLVRAPAPFMRGLYARCCLGWSERIERGVRRASGESPSIARKWRDRLSAADVSRVERVLGDSPARDWWADAECAGGPAR